MRACGLDASSTPAEKAAPALETPVWGGAHFLRLNDCPDPENPDPLRKAGPIGRKNDRPGPTLIDSYLFW